MRGAALLAEADLVAALVGDDGRPPRQSRAWRAICDGLLVRTTTGNRALGDA